jgi:hypothetical protein
MSDGQGCEQWRELDVEGDVEVETEAVETSTAKKPIAPVLPCFSTYLISRAYSFGLFLLTDLEILLAGMGDGGERQGEAELCNAESMMSTPS